MDKEILKFRSIKIEKTNFTAIKLVFSKRFRY